MNETIEKLKRFFIRRQQAYQLTFAEGPYTNVVLKDLANFCRATESAFHPDPRAHAVLEGRREVWLRIEKHLKLTNDQMWALHGKDLE